MPLRNVPVPRPRTRVWLAAPALAAAALTGISTVGPGGAVAASASPIKHVVVIYQENHSFDETLGSYCKTRAVRCDGYVGNVTLAGGTVVALHHSPDIVPDIGHMVPSQLTAVDGGKMDGWGSIKGCGAPSYACLSYYTRADIPNLTALADHFAVSDRTFSMGNSPSWGGHLYAAAATLDRFTGENPVPAQGVTPGLGWGCDSKLVTPWRNTAGAKIMVPSCVPAANGSGPFEASPVAHVPTIFDRLAAAGLSWRIYGQPAATVTGPSSHYGWSICPTFADCLYTKKVRNLVPSANVLRDAASGGLPAYSVVTPSDSSTAAVGADTSQHNGYSMVAGDDWIGKVVSAIENGPEWGSTAVFIIYDDCGCFYDHVPPPLNPDGTRAGIRMPTVIVSPYARAGALDSTTASFSSILAYTEHTFGLRALSTNDANAYDYAKVFDYSQKPLTGIPLRSSPVPAASLRYARAHPEVEDDAT
jgi:phospholipase C